MKTSLKLFTFKTVTNLFSRNFWSDFKKLENDATWHIELNSGHKQPFDKCSVSTFRKVKLCFNPHTSSRGFMIVVQGERTWFSVITSHSCGQQSIVKIRLKSFHLWSFPKVSTFSVNVRKLCWQISNLTVFENHPKSRILQHCERSEFKKRGNRPCIVFKVGRVLVKLSFWMGEFWQTKTKIKGANVGIY